MSMKSMSGDILETRKRAQKALKQMISAYIQFPKLLIAVVNGPCIGISATTAAFCDIVCPTENDYFYTLFTLLGLCEIVIVNVFEILGRFNVAQFSVDTFFTLSGMLVSISILRELSETNGKLNVKLLYFRRYLRFTSMLAVVVLFQMCLLRFFASGPNIQLIDSEGRYCDNGWWSTLFYINIYYRGGCVLTSWYLSVDLQLFIFSPILVILCRRYEKRFVKTYCGSFSYSIDGTYGSAYSRIPTWLIGVVLFYLKQYHKISECLKYKISLFI